MLLRAVPGISGKREEGLEEGFGYQSTLFGELMTPGTSPPVTEDVEGRGSVKLLLRVGRSAQRRVDPGRPSPASRRRPGRAWEA